MILYDAAVAGDLESVKRIVNQDPDSINAGDKWGFTALHGLAEEEHPAVMRYLLAMGADPNARNDQGITPMHLCAWPENAAMLIEAGGDVEIRDAAGNRPIDILSSEPDREDVVEYLLQIGSPPQTG